MFCQLNIFLVSAILKQLQCVLTSEKGRDLTQSRDKSPNTHRQSKKAKWQHKNVVKNFDYTTIADRLRTSDDSHRISVI